MKKQDPVTKLTLLFTHYMKTSQPLATLRRSAFLLLSTAAAALLLAPVPAAGDPFTFSYTGSLITARVHHTATLLPSGKVLVVGGENLPVPGSSTDNLIVLASAELYDPVSGNWTATGSLSVARRNHTATLLPNGKVLVVGGYGGTYNGSGVYLASAELYDPANGTWSATTGSLSNGRSAHTATLLINGKVLIAGGAGPDGPNGVLASAELYDPASGTSGTFTATGSLTTSRWSHTATLLPNGAMLPNGTMLPGGTVLLAGGSVGALATAELYDPVSGSWSATFNMVAARFAPTATLLPNGKVLVADGGVATAELYDPASGIWTATGSYSGAFFSNTATLLPNGQVLSSEGGAAQLYDPASGTWAATGFMASLRYDHTATLLFAAGWGFPHDELGTIATAELYDSGSATPQARTALIIPDVQELVTTGALTSNQGAALTTKLNSVISKLDSGQTIAAGNQLGAFSNQVAGFVNSHSLTPDQGQALIDKAVAVRSQIGG
jgi:hypothetical protein